MNEDKLKIKYILGTYKDSPDYPTLEDMMFQIINFNIINNKNNIISNLDVKKIFESDDENRILEILQKENFLLLEKVLKSKTNYKIIKNPFQ
jgi:hypothetical protein